MAKYTINVNRKLARIKATLDLIEGAESKSRYQDIYWAFRKFRLDSEFAQGVLHPTTPEEEKNYFDCVSHLNHYELIAVGCQKEILDADFYRLFLGYVVVRDWNEGAKLIEKVRGYSDQDGIGAPTSFREMESFVREWTAKFPEEVGSLLYNPPCQKAPSLWSKVGGHF